VYGLYADGEQARVSLPLDLIGSEVPVLLVL
jgi:hypothetical protein